MENPTRTPVDCLPTKADRDRTVELPDEAPPLIIHLSTWTNVREDTVKLPSWIILTSPSGDRHAR
jgi:hypothetical protein